MSGPEEAADHDTGAPGQPDPAGLELGAHQ